MVGFIYGFGHLVHFGGSSLLESRIRVSENTTVVIDQGSLLHSSYVVANNSTIALDDTIIEISDDGPIDIDIQANSSIPIWLQYSKMTVSNSMVTPSSPGWFIYCFDDHTTVSGDLLGWNISPQCKTQYDPFTIDRSLEFRLLMRGNKEFIQIVLDENDAGINLTLAVDINSSSLDPVIQSLTTFSEEVTSPLPPISVNMYLTQSSCNGNNEIPPESNFISSSSDTTGRVSLSFQGPSPSFLQPNRNGTTLYCLMINSSAPINYVTTLNSQYIQRTLTTSNLTLTPKYAIYSTVFGAVYQFFDQWGDPFTYTSPVDVICGNETLYCGHTYSRSSGGHVFLSFNQTLSWKMFSSVSASLSLPNSQPAMAYGIALITSLIE